MHPDDEVCLCFHVPLRKIRAFLKREDPPVASLISECLGAGTGCQWCVPFLRHLHAEHQKGHTPDLKISPQRYAQARLSYHKTGSRERDVLDDAAPGAVEPPPAARHTPPDDTSDPPGRI